MSTARIPARPKRLIFTVLTLSLSVPMTAAAHDPALISALSHFHEDPSDAVLDGFEPGLRESLMALVADADVPRLARVRALAALGRYADDDAAYRLVEEVALDMDGDIRLRIAGVGTLGQRFGHRPEVATTLAKVLEDPDAGLRRLAVEALSAVGTPEADAILSRHRMVERHALVRRALRGALEAQLGRPAPPEGPMPRVRSLPSDLPALESETTP